MGVMEDFEIDVDITSAELHNTMDARKWAEAFCGIFKDRRDEIDEELMLGWFANAIMVGFDHARNTADHIIRGQNRELSAMSYQISLHCHQRPRKNVEPQTERERELAEAWMEDRSLLSFVREHMMRIDAGEVTFPQPSPDEP